MKLVTCLIPVNETWCEFAITSHIHCDAVDRLLIELWNLMKIQCYLLPLRLFTRANRNCNVCRRHDQPEGIKKPQKWTEGISSSCCSGFSSPIYVSAACIHLLSTSYQHKRAAGSVPQQDKIQVRFPECPSSSTVLTNLDINQIIADDWKTNPVIRFRHDAWGR